MGVKVTGLKPAMDRLERLSTGFPSILENSMEMLFEDIIDQSMSNLRGKLKHTTYSRGWPNKVKLGDNLSAWDYERIGVGPGYMQWKLWNRSDHAVHVEFGTRTPIRPKGEFLWLGGDRKYTQVAGQEGKHFFGDALALESKWRNNLIKYTKSQLRQFLR